MVSTEDQRILLVGASGRVGKMVLHHWKSLGGTCIVPQFRSQSPKAGLVWDVLADAGPLLSAVEQGGAFDAMVVLAGATPKTGVDMQANVRIAEDCLAAAVKAGIRRVLLASSSAVYGAGTARPFSENSECKPVNDYGVSKLQMEQVADTWRKEGTDLCLMRIGNVAGADALLLNIAKASEAEAVKIDIFKDGRGPFRSYIGAKTMAEVLQTLCLQKAPLPTVLNLASPLPISMEQLAGAAGHPWEPREPSSTAYQNITLDCTALAALHPFTPADSDPAEMVRQWKATLVA